MKQYGNYKRRLTCDPHRSSNSRRTSDEQPCANLKYAGTRLSFRCRGIFKGFVSDGDEDKAIIHQLRTDERLDPNPLSILVNPSDLVKLSPAESRTAKRTYKNKRSVEQGIPVLSSKGDTESLSAGKAGTTVEKPSGWSISHPLLIRFLFHELPLI